jgi:hypothetical protein
MWFVPGNKTVDVKFDSSDFTSPANGSKGSKILGRGTQSVTDISQFIQFASGDESQSSQCSSSHRDTRFIIFIMSLVIIAVDGGFLK